MTAPWTPPDQWLKPWQAAKRLHVTTLTLRRRITTRDLVARRLDTGRYEYLESSVNAIADEDERRRSR